MGIAARVPRGFVLLLLTVLPPTTLTTVSSREYGLPFHDLPSPKEDAAGMRRPTTSAYVAPIAQNLRCSPVPCVLPNVDVSAGPMPVNETPITVNPANSKQFLASANDLNCLNFEGLYTSGDGGRTWTRACMNAIAGSSGEGDPSAGYDLQGNAYVTGLEYGAANGVVFEKSADNGKTWSAPRLAASLVSGAKTVDKDWLHINTNPGSPYANALYVSMSQFDGSQDSLISVSHSNDGGATWTTVAVEPYQSYPVTDEESYLASGPDGAVYLTWLRCTVHPANNGCGGTASIIEFSKSTDGGNTWTTPQAIVHTEEAPYIKCKVNFGGFFGVLPNTCDRVGNSPVIAVDNSNGPHSGNLYLTYYRWTGKFLKVFVTTSHNGGATWTKTAVAPSTDTHDQFFPWVSISSMGVVGVSWLDRRNDPKNVNYEAFAAFSSDGGASFGKNIKLSAKPSNPFNDGWGNGEHFMGDYTGNAWSPDGKTFYVTYTDTTTNVDQDFIAGIRR
jgi:hypothetical protein